MVSFFFVTNRSQCFFLKKESLSLAWGVEKQAGALADLFDRAAVQLAALLHAGPPVCTWLPSLWVCTPSLVNVKTVLIEGSVVLSSSRRHHPPPQAPVPE